MPQMFVVNESDRFSEDMRCVAEALGISDKFLDDFLLLIDNENDYEEFINHFWEGKSRQLYSIANYRNHKLAHSNYSYSEFKNDYERDRKVAIEKLFLHKTSQKYIDILERKIKDGSMTLETLYIQHCNDSDFRFEWFVSTK